MVSAESCAAAKRALETLYDGECTIYEQQPVRDAQTGIVRAADAPAAEHVPCRLSYAAARPASLGPLGAALTQTATLFTAPEDAPPEGARIVVTHRGRTEAYTASGPAAVYPTHAQVAVKIEQAWA